MGGAAVQMTIQQIKTVKKRNRRADVTRHPSGFKERDGILQGWLAVSEEGIFVVQDGRIKQCNHFLARLGGYLDDCSFRENFLKFSRRFDEFLPFFPLPFRVVHRSPPKEA